MGRQRVGASIRSHLRAIRLNDEELVILDGNLEASGEAEVSAYFRRLMYEDHERRERQG